MKCLQLAQIALAIFGVQSGASAFILDKAFGAFNEKITDGIQSAVDIGLGAVKDLENQMPLTKLILDINKQALTGYPFKIIADAINTVCSMALTTRSVKPKVTPEIDKMKFQLRTACKKYSFPLLEADKMWKSPEFDAKKRVVILATGWTTTVNETDTMDVLAKAYNCRGDVNFVVVDAAQYVDTLYTWSALNTEEIGKHIGIGLMKLEEIVPLENIHLIGHSLGAHIVGAAGRYFHYNTGRTIPRITGLDPAKPCFNEGEKLTGLSRGDADFIDIIHSDSGVLGQYRPLGDVDFYPHGLSPIMPGCIDIICSHARSWWYYAETVYPGNEANFLGKRCSSLQKLLTNRCPGASHAMGFAVPHNIRGSYFLEVNSEPPFGTNSNRKVNLMRKSCGLCET